MIYAINLIKFIYLLESNLLAITNKELWSLVGLTQY